MSSSGSDPARLARLRATSQLLHRPNGPTHPADIARSIAGAQAQDKRAGLLQLRARSPALTADAVERARVEERSLVRGWLMRRTVHLVDADDYRWMRPLFAPAISRESRRRLGQLGLDAAAQERALALIRAKLGREGTLSRNALVERLERGGIEVDSSIRMHLMRVVAAEGIACIGPDEGANGTLVLAEEWLGAAPTEDWDGDAALAELARRYVGAFAPAGERDFAKWSGLGLRDCRRGLELIADELAEVPQGSGLAAPSAARPRPARTPLVRLLGAFDTYLMGYETRAHAVGPADERKILPGGGILRPTLCLDGRLVGLWSAKRGGGRLRVSIEPFDGLADPWREAVEAEVADVGRFEGLPATLVSD